MHVRPHELAQMIGGGINAGHILRAIKAKRLQAAPDGLLEASSALARWRATVRPKPTRGPGRPRKSAVPADIDPEARSLLIAVAALGDDLPCQRATKESRS